MNKERSRWDFRSDLLLVTVVNVWNRVQSEVVGLCLIVLFEERAVWCMRGVL